MTRLESARNRGLLRDYALIGGFAVSAWGVPRATQDFDFAIAIGSTDPLALSAFMGGRYQAGEADDPLRGVVNVPIAVGDASVPLQLVCFPASIAAQLFQGTETLSILDCSVPVVSWQSLILLKLYAGGPQDVWDAQQILKVKRPQADEAREIASMAETAGLLDEWTALWSQSRKA